MESHADLDRVGGCMWAVVLGFISLVLFGSICFGPEVCVCICCTVGLFWVVSCVVGLIWVCLFSWQPVAKI